MPLNKDGFDLVTSQYLFPYANTKDELLKMCKAAFSALKSGGSYVGVTTWLDSDNPPKAQSAILGKYISILYYIFEFWHLTWQIFPL